MKKIISMVLSFILILGCSTTAFAAETHNYDTENLPHDGADYFETEIKADEENEERISDFVTVYGYQYTKRSLNLASAILSLHSPLHSLLPSAWRLRNCTRQ